MKLWQHQKLAHAKVIDAFKNNLKPVLVMPTGSGKSITMTSFVAKYPHYKFVLIVRTRGLVYQLEEDLKLFGLDYSLFMAGEEVDLSKRIQLCSKDTIDSRDLLPFEGEEEVVVIYDEADENKSFQQRIINRYNKAKRFFYAGMTATPYNGLDQFDIAVEPITAEELRRQGILVDYNYFIPKKIDYSKYQIVKGQFKKEEVLSEFNNPHAIMEAFKQWQNFGDNRQTLIFNVNKQHSKNTVKLLNEYYKKEVAVHCDADTPKEKREEAKMRFNRGEIRFISNVRLFTRGTNIPLIGGIWDQAPTLSDNLHIQKLGRGSRKNDVYKDCIILDIANNCINNGGFYAKREINLQASGVKSKEDLQDFRMIRCEKCFKGYEAANICPYCGHKKPIEKKKPISNYMKEKLFMESATEEAIEQRKMIKEFKKELWKYQNLGKKYPYQVARKKAQDKLISRYGRDKCMKIRRSIGL